MLLIVGCDLFLCIMKSELFAKILETVAQVTELSTEQILSKTKTDDLVAARSLFVHHCVGFGVPSISIAGFLGRTGTHCVGRYLADYQHFMRTSYLFREMNSRIVSALESHRERN